MEFAFKQPKLKDSLYGEMFWEDFDEYQSFWYAPMKTEKGERFDLLIRADSQADFLAVRGTHATYRRIMERLDAICDEMLGEILRDSLLLKKRRQRDSAAEKMKKSLRLFAIKIAGDLSAEVQFVERVGETEDPGEVFYAVLDPKGNLDDVGVEDL
jgi:hypothetical protein